MRSDSSTVIAHTSAASADGAGQGTRLLFHFWSEPSSGMHPIVVPADQPRVPITFKAPPDGYANESDHDPNGWPIPLDARREGDGAHSDRHVIVVQQGTCQLYEMWNATPTGSGWNVGTAAQWDLRSNARRPDGWTSADAAGLPILPGLLRYDEVASGHIDHALRFTVKQARNAFVYPATHRGSFTDPAALPMGARLRLRPDFDTSRFTGQSRVIVEALKTYGMILADEGSPNWMISGEGDARWNDTDMDQIRAIQASDFQYLDTGTVR